MNHLYYLYLAAAVLPAGAQPLNSLVEEALRNNREILAAQKKYASRAPAAGPDQQYGNGFR